MPPVYRTPRLNCWTLRHRSACQRIGKGSPHQTNYPMLNPIASIERKYARCTWAALIARQIFLWYSLAVRLALAKLIR